MCTGLSCSVTLGAMISTMRRVGRTALVAVAAATMLAGCSWIFQDRMRGGMVDYEARSEPQCSTGRGWPGLDTIFAVLGGLSVVAGATAADDVPSETKTAWILGGITNIVIHGASAASGYRWAGECREAYEIWEQTPTAMAQNDERRRAQLAKQFSANPTNDPEKAASFWCGRGHRCTVEETTCSGMCEPRETAWCALTDEGFICGVNRGTCLAQVEQTRARPRGECVERRAALWAGPPARNAPVETTLAAAPPPSPEKPRGHFCASSFTQPSASLCAREKSDCQAARDAALAVVADLSECTLLETAHCFETDGRERCFPTPEACSARSAAAACDVRS